MKIGQVNLSYVGTQYQTPNGGTLTVIGESGRRRGKNIIWEVECSICSQDKELFPHPFDGNKFQMDNGQCPCACSLYRYTEEQNKIRLFRLGLAVKKVEGEKYFVEDLANEVCYSGAINQLLNGYNFQALVPVSLRTKVESKDGNKARLKRCKDEFNKLILTGGMKVTGEYKNSSELVEIKCSKGHAIKVQPKQFKYRGGTCTECVSLGISETNRKQQIYRKANKERYAAQQKKYHKENPMQAFTRDTLKRIEKAVGKDRINRAELVLGYTQYEFVAYIESQFKDGMSWDRRSEFHIDHIKPVSAFLDEGITDPKIINALSNLQPLWAHENLSKGAKY